MHQVVSISTKLHQSAQSATKLYQVASTNLQQVAPNSTKLHQSAVEDYEMSFRLLLNYILLNFALLPHLTYFQTVWHFVVLLIRLN